MSTFEHILHRQRWINWHPAEKATLAFGLLFINLLTKNDVIYFISIIASIGLLLFSANVTIRLYIKALSIPLLFLLISISTFFITIDFNSETAFPSIAVTAEVWQKALIVFLRSFAAYHALLLFIFTTSLPDALCFFKRLGMPSVILEVALLIYNMFYVLIESMLKIYRSQVSRFGYSDFKTSYQSCVLLASTLFVQSFTRAKRLERGLYSRGFTGALTVLVEFMPISKKRFAYIICFLLLMMFFSFFYTGSLF